MLLLWGPTTPDHQAAGGGKGNVIIKARKEKNNFDIARQGKNNVIIIKIKIYLNTQDIYLDSLSPENCRLQGNERTTLLLENIQNYSSTQDI